MKVVVKALVVERVVQTGLKSATAPVADYACTPAGDCGCCRPLAGSTTEACTDTCVACFIPRRPKQCYLQKKDGTDGKLTVLPPVEQLQLEENTRERWIDYSAFDAKATWDLHQALEASVRGVGCSRSSHIFFWWASCSALTGWLRDGARRSFEQNCGLGGRANAAMDARNPSSSPVPPHLAPCVPADQTAGDALLNGPRPGRTLPHRAPGVRFRSRLLSKPVLCQLFERQAERDLREHQRTRRGWPNQFTSLK